AMWGQRDEGALVVAVNLGLRAEKHEICATHSANFCRSHNAHFFLKVQRVQKQAILRNRLDERRTPDQHDWCAGPRQQSAKISPHGPRANDGDSGPRLRWGHGVTTLMSRSMSRSVLYR